MEDILAPLGSSALILPDGQTLLVRPSRPADLATLPQAASLCHQYLRLSDGDAALLNDPFSGGTLLSELTVVLGVSFESPGPEADLLIAQRIALPARLGEQDHLDHQGVRIPPTPLATKGQINSELLAAIASHPLAPQGLALAVSNSLDALSSAARELKGVGRDPGSELKRANFKSYFANCSWAFETLLSRLPLGATQVSTRLPSGELIKLQLEVSDTKLHFDFAGTDASSQIGLTELATFGACLAATAAALKQPIPFNSGVFEHFQVSTPSKTLLSSRAPTGLFRGMTAGVAAVSSLVLDAFGKLNSSFKRASSSGGTGHFFLQFEDGRFYSGQIAPGTGASRESAGIDATGLWSARLHEPLPLQDVERSIPLRLNMAGLRAGSGGKGKKAGGNGALQAFTVQAAATLRWSFGSMAERHEGMESGRAGNPALIELTRANGSQEEYTAAEGSLALAPGDQVRLYGSGGGGFGEPPNEASSVG